MHLPPVFWAGFGCGVLFITVAFAFASALALAADRKPPKPAPRLTVIQGDGAPVYDIEKESK